MTRRISSPDPDPGRQDSLPPLFPFPEVMFWMKTELNSLEPQKQKNMHTLHFSLMVELMSLNLMKQEFLFLLQRLQLMICSLK